jgi:hypothetical protein
MVEVSRAEIMNPRIDMLVTWMIWWGNGGVDGEGMKDRLQYISFKSIPWFLSPDLPFGDSTLNIAHL